MLTFEQYRDAIIDRAEELLATCRHTLTGGMVCSPEAVEALRTAFGQEFDYA